MSTLSFQKTIAYPSSKLKRLQVRVPASSANLGPGFDTLAIAYNLYCTLDIRILEACNSSIPLITLNNPNVESLAKDESNLVYQILKQELADKEDLLQRLRISIDSDIPLARGLGSSAAAATAAIFAGIFLSGKEPDDKEVLAKAHRLEGHADNAAASLLGGLVVSSQSGENEISTQKLSFPEDWKSIVIAPPYELSTKKARSVLPKQYTREAAVNNLQRVALLLAAVCKHDEDAMRQALTGDLFHEPYRMELVPELAAIRKCLSDFPILGCVLSGAGPSVLCLLTRRQSAQVHDALSQWSAHNCPKAKILDLEIDQEGLMVSYET